MQDKDALVYPIVQNIEPVPHADILQFNNKALY